MMALLSMRDVSLSFGGPALLDKVNLQIEEGERVCLVGRNGAGKSTLMKLINGDTAPEGGAIALQKGARAAYLLQEVPEAASGRIFEVVADGQKNTAEHQIQAVLTRLQLPAEADFATLSGGLKRRVFLARALACDPDILLLDEPTNHLDVESIAWLEDFLVRYVKTVLFVTHDRVFLQRLATRIVEIDRGKLATWECDYATYLERKEAQLEAEEKQNALFDKKLAAEEVWVRKGVKARETRNEGRVRALQQLRDERRARREVSGAVRIETQETERSGHRVVEARNVQYSYDQNTLIRDFSTKTMRGDKVGIIGANGSGKTTLLRLLLGEIEPQAGTVQLGTRLQIAYFDQLRAQLEEDKTVQQNVAGENDTVLINGERRHIIGYLQEWLFEPQRARTNVSVLSGGERNRLLLARLFTQPSNVLVMDEPTNDLDIETLELLEAMLVNYPGTLLIVSHDRAFLNNVVTSTLAPLGDGLWREYVGGYDDWQRQRAAELSTAIATTKLPKPTVKTAPAKNDNARPRKLSFKERHELEALPARIEALESEHETLVAAMGEADFYKGEASATMQAKTRLENIEQELAQAYARWQVLEELNG